MGRAILLVAIPETLVILGFAVAAMVIVLLGPVAGGATIRAPSGIAALLAALRAEAEAELAAPRRPRRASRREAITEQARADAERLEREPVLAQEPELQAEVAATAGRRRASTPRGPLRDAREACFQEALGAPASAARGAARGAVLSADLRGAPRGGAGGAADRARGSSSTRATSGWRGDVAPRARRRAGARDVGRRRRLLPTTAALARNTLEERLANAEPALRVLGRSRGSRAQRVRHRGPRAGRTTRTGTRACARGARRCWRAPTTRRCWASTSTACSARSRGRRIAPTSRQALAALPRRAARARGRALEPRAHAARRARLLRGRRRGARRAAALVLGRAQRRDAAARPGGRSRRPRTCCR